MHVNTVCATVCMRDSLYRSLFYYSVMKRISVICCIFSTVAVLIAPCASLAQSITINSVSATQFCAGDPIAVTFTVSGTWARNNAFTLQLSDTGGSFSNGVFTNIGSIADTIAGTFTISSAVPAEVTYSPHYRIRVVGVSQSFIASADNGSDISIGTADHHQFQQFTAWTINTPITFNLFSLGPPSKNADTLYWNFGDGANPATAVEVPSRNSQYSHTTTYSTAGLKTVVAKSISPGGCTASDTLLTYIFDCSPHPIPHNAYIIDKDSDLNNADPRIPIRMYANIWVNPGVRLTGGEFDTIFAEAGSTIGDGPGNTVFLHPGAMYNGRTAYVVIYAEGASVDPHFAGGPTLKCDSVHFDYSIAPPNLAMGINVETGAVDINAVPARIEISPNPTNGLVTLTGIPADAHVTAMNVLGEIVAEIKVLDDGSATLQLSHEAAGTYYLRIASNSRVVTKKIVKE
jgi:hypothetical protein